MMDVADYADEISLKMVMDVAKDGVRVRYL
jgi:hypothetical protein